MMAAKELKAWAATLADDETVGIEAGGLCLLASSGAWIELGGYEAAEAPADLGSRIGGEQ